MAIKANYANATSYKATAICGPCEMAGKVI